MPADNNKPNNRTGLTGWKRWLTISLFLTAGLLLISLGALTYILTDDKRVETALERLITVTTDRAFNIEGDFSFSLGSDIVISAKEITWANPEWSTEAHLLEVGSLNASIELRSLFAPPVIISNAKASDAHLEFEWREDGAFNWDFYPGEDDEDDDDDGTRHPLPLLLDAAELKNVELVFKDPALSKPLVWQVKTAQQQQDTANRLVISADTSLNETPLELDGYIGPFPDLIVAGSVEMALNLRGQHATLDLEAEVDSLIDLGGAEFDLRWQSEEVANVLEVLNLPAATSGPGEIVANLETNAGQLDASINGDFGEFNVEGKLRAPEFNILADLELALDSTGPSAAAVGALIDIDGLPSAPYELHVRADTINDELEISQFYFETADAELTAKASLPRPPTLIDADMNLVAGGNDLSRFQGLTDEISFAQVPFSADINIQGNGEGKPDSFEAKLVLAKATGDFSGTLQETTDYAGSELEYQILFPDAQALARMFNIRLTREEKLTAAGKAAVRKDGLELQNLTIEAGGNTQVINGLIPRASVDKPISLTTVTTGASFRGLLGLYLPGTTLPSTPYNLRGNLEIDGDKLLISNSAGTVGNTKLTTKGRVDMASDEIDIALQLTAEGPDIDEWLADIVLEERIQDAFRFSGEIQVKDDSLKVADLSLDIRDARIRGDITSGWPEDPDSYGFDLDIKGQNLALELPKFSGYEPAEVPYELRAIGDLDETHLDIDQLKGNIGSAKTNIEGTISLTDETKQSLNIDLRGDRIADLGTIEGWQVKDGPFSILGKIDSEGESIRIDDLDMTLGPNDLKGSIKAIFDEKPKFEATLSSKNFDIGAVLTKEQSEALDDALDAESEDGDGMLIADTNIPVEILNEFDADVRLRVATISRKDERFSKLMVEGRLQDGALTIPRFIAYTTLGDLRSSLSYVPVENTYELTAELNANNVRLVAAKQSATDAIPYQGHNIDFRLVGRGTNAREIVSELDGFLWIRGEQRQIENVKYSSLFGDGATEVGALVNPFYKKDPFTTIECERYLLEIENGIMASSPLLYIKTDKLNMAGAGTIDLTTERVRLGIETIPRKGLGLSASDLFTPFVRVGGTMAEPRPEVDPKGSLVEGGAAVMTAGLSIVAKSLYQRWIKADKNCVEYTEMAREIRAKRDPLHVPMD